MPREYSEQWKLFGKIFIEDYCRTTFHGRGGVNFRANHIQKIRFKGIISIEIRGYIPQR